MMQVSMSSPGDAVKRMKTLVVQLKANSRQAQYISIKHVYLHCVYSWLVMIRCSYTGRTGIFSSLIVR